VKNEMGILKDIFDLMREIDVKNVLNDYYKTKKYSSISKRASEGILQFPVLVTDSLDIETLQMVTKALERNYTTFVQVVLSMDPIMNLKNERDIGEYLKKFHQNTDTKVDGFDVHNLGVDLGAFNESFTCLVSDDERNVMITFVHENMDRKLIKQNKELLKSVYDDIITECLNNKYIPQANYTYRFKNGELNRIYNGPVKSILEAKESKPVKKKESKPVKIDDSKELGSPKMLTDNDVKKSNELIPTTLNVKLKVINKDEEDVGFINFIIGVKAVMHPIKSNEMIENLVKGFKNSGKFFNFIRWTTGEISFFKDLMLKIGEIKDDVVSRSSGTSHWWLTLKRRRKLAHIKDIVGKRQLLPNTTIVVSADEIEKIKAEYGIDLMNEKNIDKIMKEYFLLGFVVVDNSTQIVHFLFDGQYSFQSVTFRSLERENTNKSAEFKEMLKLINKI